MNNPKVSLALICLFIGFILGWIATNITVNSVKPDIKDKTEGVDNEYHPDDDSLDNCGMYTCSFIRAV